MDYLNENISINLKRIRTAKGYSLDTVAEQTGVSKSMLGQIERGEANPTIGTLGKIVSGLRVKFDDLISVPCGEIYPIERDKLIPSKEIPGQYRVYTFFPFEKERPFEIYVITVMPYGRYVSGAHGENTKEYVMVTEGILHLVMNGEDCKVKKGNAIRFDSDKEHIYENTTDKILEFISVFCFA